MPRLPLESHVLPVAGRASSTTSARRSAARAAGEGRAPAAAAAKAAGIPEERPSRRSARRCGVKAACGQQPAAARLGECAGIGGLVIVGGEGIGHQQRPGRRRSVPATVEAPARHEHQMRRGKALPACRRRRASIST
jgi:hypothetical protein